MTLPGNVGTGFVTGTFMDSAGTLLSGTITFTASPTKILDATASPPTTIVPQPVTVTLSAGTFTKELVATNDADLNPTGFTYLVSFNLASGTQAIPVASFSIAVPQGLVGAAVDLTTASPVASSNGESVETYISVTKYGATGDGTTDDTTAINNALNAIPAGGGELHFPPGTYKVTSTIDLGTRTNVHMTGVGGGENTTVGIGASVITYSGTGYALQWAASAPSALFAGIIIEGIHVRGSGTTPTGGIYLGNGSNWKLIDVTVSDFHNGSTNAIGIRVGTATSTGAQYGEARGCVVSLCDIHYKVDNANGLRIIGGVIEGVMPSPTTGTIGILTTAAADTLTAVGLVIQGCDTLVDSSGSNCSFIGVRSEGFTTQAYKMAGSMNQILGGSITNYINGSVGTGIAIQSGADTTLVEIAAVSSVASKLTDAGTNTVARYGWDTTAITPGKTSLTHTEALRVNKTGSGAQDPQLTLESNATPGPTVKTESSFSRMVLDHAYSGATRMSLRLAGNEVIGVNTYGAQIAGAAAIYSGSGLPGNYGGSGLSAVKGDIYLRTDTPSTSTQRLYICTANGVNWTGIL